MASKSARASSKGSFTRALKSLRKGLDDGVLLITAQKKYEKLKQTWEEVQINHQTYLNTLTDETEIATEDDWIESIANDFDEIEIDFDKYCENLTKIREEESNNRDAKNKDEETKTKTKLLLTKIGQQEAKIVGGIANLNKVLSVGDPKEKQTAYIVIDEQLEELENEEKCLTKLINEILIIINDDEKLTQINETYTKIIKEYEEAKFKGRIFSAEHKKTDVNKLGAISSGNVRLEKLKFQTFSGDIRKYPKFKEEFLQHIKPNYNLNEEAFVLKHYLSDDIVSDVENLGDDAELIWERLDSKFGDKNRLVDAIMTEFKSLKRTNNNPSAIINMINTVEKAYRDLKMMGKESEINNSTIVSIIEEILPTDIETEWVKMITTKGNEHIKENKFPALLALLLEFKERLEYKNCNIRNDTATNKISTHHVSTKETGKTPERPKRPICWIHPNQNDHPIWKCQDFETKSHTERMMLVRENRACFSCLAQGHRADQCRRNFKCQEDGCRSNHHRLLHERQEGINHHNKSGESDNVLLQLQTLRASNGSWRTTSINVLWDTGSTVSFITFDKAKEMKLIGNPVKLTIVKVGGDVEEVNSFKYTLKLFDDKGSIIEIKAFGIDSISNKISPTNMNVIKDLFPECDINELNRPQGGTVDCLMGIEYAAFHPVKYRENCHMLLLRNRFGTVISGKYSTDNNDSTQTAEVHHASTVVNDFFTIEQLGVECNPKCGACKCGKCQLGGKEMTLKEEREYELIHKNLNYDSNERKWEAHYPWIKDPNLLPNNKMAVAKNLRNTEKRLLNDPELAVLYDDQITDMLSRGVCRKLTKDEADKYSGPTFYIPHHLVYKPDSKSTPIRLVFNSSANYNGHVLNEYYAKGPDMLNNLLGVLLRFREERYAFVGDIKKMFHSVKIPIIDQMTHRFLWRNMDLRESPDEYAMTAVNFGDKPSGSIAIVALQKTAEMSKEKHPKAAKVLQENSYMDDILDSVDSPEDVTQLTSAIEDVLSLGGFKIKEWLYSAKPEQTQYTPPMKNSTVSNRSEKVLGMGWNPETDQFKFEYKPSECTKQLTKRKVLAQVNGIFDPIGLLTPFSVKSKVLMRKLWTDESKLGWDDIIPEHLEKEWKEFFTDINNLNQVKFERCVKPMDAIGNPQLIIFSDASKEAYGAVAYARWKCTNDEYKASLIASKNRVSPIKVTDIVKLELSGAVLGKRLREFIKKQMRYQFSQIYHIVDSEIVRAMIAKESYGFNTFAANRVGEIQSATQDNEWYWLPGKENIGDFVTRSKKPEEIREDSKWQRGPQFLYQSESSWPIQSKTSINEVPYLVAQVNKAAVSQVETLTSRFDLNRFSNMNRLLYTTARILQLFRWYRTPNERQKLDIRDIYEAENLWIKHAQLELHDMISSNRLRRLCPKINDGIIYVGGRAERWMEMTWNKQMFILLPKNSRLSILIADKIHKEIGHLRVAATIAAIRAKYWIIGIHTIVRSICYKCTLCRIKNKRLAEQYMGALPIERLKPAPIFHSTGVDYFGPFTIRGEVQKRVRGKCFAVIFTCMVSRAVYVDLSQDYSTDKLLMTLRRFASCCGWPNIIFSDQGSQLVGASNELKQAIKGIDKQRLLDLGIRHGTH